MQGRGDPCFGKGKRRNGVQLYIIVYFDPFLDLWGRKTLKIRLNYPLGTFLVLFGSFSFFCDFCPFRTFLLIFLLCKASDKRVGGPLFLGERGYPALFCFYNSDPLRTRTVL
jgi:hypothetical protein